MGVAVRAAVDDRIEHDGFILVVEDDCRVARSYCRGLGTEFPVVCVETGGAAIELIRARGTSVLGAIIDIVLPDEVDGLCVLKQLHASAGDVPAIVITGHANPTTREEVLALRTPYVAKGDQRALTVAASAFLRYLRVGRHKWDLALAALAHSSALTARQVEILRLRIRGISRVDVPDVLGVTSETVTFHLDGIRSRLGVATEGDIYLQLAAIAATL